MDEKVKNSDETMAQAGLPRRTLADIVDDYVSTMWKIDEAEGEISPSLEAELDAVQAGLCEKVESCLWAATTAKTWSKTLKERAQALSKRAAALEAQEDRVRAWVLENLERSGLRNLQTISFKASLRMTKPNVEIYDPEQLVAIATIRPELFTVRPPEPIRAEIKNEVLNGRELPGCRIVDPRAFLVVS